ncbi:MAG: hypothetical protein FWG73_09655 [Planctomycetaceae bacterium]|nr:hypothetical protein [Planctomycetaceae bacterium]
MGHTINVADLADQDTVHRFLQEMQSHGASYSLIQNGIEVARIVPTEENNERMPDERMQKENILQEIKAFHKKYAGLWNTNETAPEAVANDRR